MKLLFESWRRHLNELALGEPTADVEYTAFVLDDPNFHNEMERLSEKYCQDSVLIIPQGGKGAYLMGTNNSDYPGYGEKEVVGNLKMGKEAEFMTRVKGRPYTFTVTESLETFKGLTRLEKMAVKSICKRLIKS